MKIAKQYGLQLKGKDANPTQAHIYFQLQDWLAKFYNYYETKEEYEVSKKLILGFVTSKQAVDTFGSACSKAFNSYLVTSFFPHEASIAYYKHIAVLNYEKTTSNPFEGMNLSMKHIKGGLKSNMNLDRSMTVQHEQSHQREFMRKTEGFRRV